MEDQVQVVKQEQVVLQQLQDQMHHQVQVVLHEMLVPHDQVKIQELVDLQVQTVQVV